MILKGSLRLEHKGKTYILMVNTFLKHGTYYFFISDKDRTNPLIGGETLELTYSASFCHVEEEQIPASRKIPAEIISAVENMLMENKKLWYY